MPELQSQQGPDVRDVALNLIAGINAITNNLRAALEENAHLRARVAELEPKKSEASTTAS